MKSPRGSGNSRMGTGKMGKTTLAHILAATLGLRYGRADNDTALPRLRAAVKRFAPPTKAP